MRRFFDGIRLLRQSERCYTKLGLSPPQWNGFDNPFKVGGGWMKDVLGKLVGTSLPRWSPPFREIGYFKYGLALWVSILTICLFSSAGIRVALILACLVFYMVESQMVFLFPIFIEGVADPIDENLRQVRRAGGPFRVFITVLFVAFYMVTGGFFRRGLKRSWCVGCLAVLLWHLQVKKKRIKLHETV